MITRSITKTCTARNRACPAWRLLPYNLLKPGTLLSRAFCHPEAALRFSASALRNFSSILPFSAYSPSFPAVYAVQNLFVPCGTTPPSAANSVGDVWWRPFCLRSICSTPFPIASCPDVPPSSSPATTVPAAASSAPSMPPCTAGSPRHGLTTVSLSIPFPTASAWCSPSGCGAESGRSDGARCSRERWPSGPTSCSSSSGASCAMSGPASEHSRWCRAAGAGRG